MAKVTDEKVFEIYPSGRLSRRCHVQLKPLPEQVISFFFNTGQQESLDLLAIEKFITDEKCSKPTPTDRKFSEDRFGLDEENKIFYCKLCPKGYSTRKYVEFHLKHHHPRVCLICLQMFPTLDHMNDHNASLHKICPSCDVCEESFRTHEDLQTHKKIHTYEGFTCKICHLWFELRKNFLSHFEVHMSTGERFKCDKCDRNYSRTAHLNEHKRRDHGDNVNGRHIFISDSSRLELCSRLILTCGVCKQECIGAKTAAIHMVNHHGVHSCKECKVFFSGQLELRKHQKRVHKPLQQLSCDICHKLFADSSTLKCHKLDVHAGSKYSCDQCGKDYSCRPNLHRHKRAAHKQVAHTCTLCDKVFNVRGNLKRHNETVHKKLGKKVCTVCGYKGTDITRHVAEKHSETPLKCDICDKKFSTKYGLSAHNNQNHSLNPRLYKCTACTETFLTPQLKQFHYRKVHCQEPKIRKKLQCDQCQLVFGTDSGFKQHKESKHLKEEFKVEEDREG